jgi:5-methylcytosine-specific restriction protein A
VERQHTQKTSERGYGWDWQKFRKRFLADHPLCEDCETIGRVTPATEVHHLVKIKHDASKRLDEGNLLALCGRCHQVRTAKGE